MIHGREEGPLGARAECMYVYTNINGGTGDLFTYRLLAEVLQEKKKKAKGTKGSLIF